MREGEEAFAEHFILLAHLLLRIAEQALIANVISNLAEYLNFLVVVAQFEKHC